MGPHKPRITQSHAHIVRQRPIPTVVIESDDGVKDFQVVALRLEQFVQRVVAMVRGVSVEVVQRRALIRRLSVRVGCGSAP